MLSRLLVAACLAAAPVCAAMGQELGDAGRGRIFAAAHCAACHGIERDADTSPEPGVATFSVIARTPGMTALALNVWLQTPHREMPNFIIAAQDRDDIVAYVRSLRR